ncbi:MAG: HAD hydrolase-like protein [Bacteroidota bacterium]
MILVFDLDDTLYNEITFVESGFRAVANYLASAYGLSKNTIFEELWSELQANGRGKVFNKVLKDYDLLSKKSVLKCLSTYRTHFPDIQLHKQGKSCLERFQDHTKFLVTDGNKIVQYNKVKALGIEPLFKKVFITHRYGLKASKPSPICFRKISQMERVKPEEIVYIGDNPNKDFVGIKPLGFKTIRVLTGHFRNQAKPEAFEAHFSIDSLDELTENLINQLKHG